MNVLLISTYELGHQPLSLASPAAWLRRAGAAVTCVDASVSPLTAAMAAEAGLIAISVPMHRHPAGARTVTAPTCRRS